MLIVMGVVAVGCGKKTEKKKETEKGVVGLASCREALRKAAGSPAHERVTAIVRGCPVCGPSFEPLIPAAAGHADLEQVNQLVLACALPCKKSAIGRWRGLLADALPGQGLQRPWRALAEDCPEAMHTDGATLRFASAPWFALARIGDALTAARATLPPSIQAELDAERAAIAIPLPPWTAASTGLVVPPGRARPGIPWRAVTITDLALLVSRLPLGRLDTTWRVEAPGAPFPGTPANDLARDLAALGPPPVLADRVDDVLVIAPIAAPAARLAEAVRALGGEPAALAVAVPEATSLWRGAVAAHAVRIAPGGQTTIRIADLPPGATVEDVVKRLDEAAAAGHTTASIE